MLNLDLLLAQVPRVPVCSYLSKTIICTVYLYFISSFGMIRLCRIQIEYIQLKFV